MPGIALLLSLQVKTSLLNPGDSRSRGSGQHGATSHTSVRVAGYSALGQTSGAVQGKFDGEWALLGPRGAVRSRRTRHWPTEAEHVPAYKPEDPGQWQTGEEIPGPTEPILWPLHRPPQGGRQVLSSWPSD